MEIWPRPFLRGDSLENFDGTLVGGIGAFSEACVGGAVLCQPLEVLLVEGRAQTGLHARLGDAHHRLYEGTLTQAKVSFTLEAFQTDSDGDILKALGQDSRTLRFSPKGELRHFILNMVEKEKIGGALLHLRGEALQLRVYGHTDTKKLNNETKTFDEVNQKTGVEGWGNLSFVDGSKPFIHMHGTYEAHGKKKGGHFIMDESTQLLLEKGELIVYPFSSLARTKQAEDFPTWKV